MKRTFLATAVFLAMITGLSGTALAVSSYLNSFNSTYGTSGTVLNTCSLCHPGGNTGSFNPYGTAYRNNSNFAAIANLDSDGDGFTNIAEITARTFPGDPASYPAASDTTAPVVTGFTIPASSTSLTVAITTLTATDATGVTGYLVTETSSTPSASAAGWSAAKPASYTFASAGVKTLYGWARDAAGNVSAPLSDTTTITLPDTTAPVVTGFTIPTSSTSLTVAITTLTATDATGVTGYLVTEASSTPSASAAGWSVAKPASYTFASAGVKTLYGWARDAAGNISAPLTDTTTITLPDTTAPVVTGFTIPATSTSLTVAVTTLTATDATGVTGYLVTESASIPSPSAAGWSAAKPASYTFASAGEKTLYGWAKDAAGNVSAPLEATTTVTLADTTAPVVTGFTIPATSTSLTVAISSFTATDSMGVTGYLVTETSSTPSASAAGWSAAVPTSHTFGSAGAKTLYAWAKDAAGNIGGAISTVVITLSDTTAPVITGFAIPATSTSLTVAVTTFTATDAVGVTGYLVTESSATPSVSASGWRGTAPASYTFSAAGTNTLYAWVKDAAGNIGGAISSVVITLGDDTAPVVTKFDIPSSSRSFTVSVREFTATDDVRVTGYLITETAKRPRVRARGWRSTPPASYTFRDRSSAGVKTLFAWVKDEAGTISESVSRSVTITARPDRRNDRDRDDDDRDDDDDDDDDDD